MKQNTKLRADLAKKRLEMHMSDSVSNDKRSFQSRSNSKSTKKTKKVTKISKSKAKANQDVPKAKVQSSEFILVSNRPDKVFLSKKVINLGNYE